MAASVTLTLSGVGRAPGCFRASALTASCALFINSGAKMIMPHATSGFTCWLLSCLGDKAAKVQGSVMVPQGTGEVSGPIRVSAASTQIFLSTGSLERNAGTTMVVKGSAQQT